MERCAVFESVRAESIAKAVAQRQYQLESIERMFEYQKYAADKICENNKNELSTTLLKELTEKAEIINAKLLGQNEPRGGEPRIQRTLRSKRGKGDEGTAHGSGGGGTSGGLNTGLTSSGGLPGTSSNTGLTTIYEHPPPVLSIPLPSTDAIADMKVIYRDWKAVAQKWRQVNATALLPTRVELNKLYYINDEFNRGDPVIVFSELTKEEFYGHLHLLSAIEVIVKLGSGSRIRIPLQHLRHGRVSLYKYAIGQGPNGGRIPVTDGTGDNTNPSASNTGTDTTTTTTTTGRKQTNTTNRGGNSSGGGGNRPAAADNVRRTNVPVVQGQQMPNAMVPPGMYIPPPGSTYPSAQIILPPMTVNPPVPTGPHAPTQ